MYCSKCGTKNDDDSKFCIKCGIDLQSGIYTGTAKIKKIIGEKSGKIDIKNRKILTTTLIVAIIGLVIIILIAHTFLSDNRNIDIYDNTELPISDNAAISNTDTFGQNQTIPSQETTNVLISSVPSGANIYIDNIYRGETPVAIGLPEGSYSIRMNITGYKNITSNFNVTLGNYTNVTAKFEPIK